MSVIAKKAVLEHITECVEKYLQNYKDMEKEALIGYAVLTRYNNNTYRIDDIDFTKNPKAKFMKGDTLNTVSTVSCCRVLKHLI